ncbi:MAG: ParB/RepB/Spo0J family partition protein [Parcubacteria group bacterium]|nr:ParB/RepB/Spo0J family partition protein [Parcubacteria group bacterium]
MVHLGRGLEALIPRANKTIHSSLSSSSSDEKDVSSIAITKIIPNKHQPRKNFNHLELEELIKSIKIHGVIEPIVVRRDGELYEIIAGERRFRAAQMAGIAKIPAIIRENVEDREKLELALVENIQRKDLNPIERARAYTYLMENFTITQDDLAERIGKSRSSVANTLRILNLPQEIITALEEERLSEGHAKTLLSLSDKRQQLKLFKKIVALGLSVRATESFVHKIKKIVPQSNEAMTKLLNRLEEFFSTKVALKGTQRVGKIVIHYYSEEELKEILKKIGVKS